MDSGMPHHRAVGHRLGDDEGGFTLVELMVVLLISAILLGLGIPTYLAETSHSEESAAQAALDTALTQVQSYYDNHESYAGLSSSQMASADPSTDYVSASGPHSQTGKPSVAVIAGPGTGEVTGGITGPQSASLASWAANGTCWYVVDVEAVGSAWLVDSTPGMAGPGVYYGANPDSGGSSCAPLAPSNGVASGWQPQGASQSDWATVQP